jgi:hypothetical protein
MYVDGQMRLVETISGMGGIKENDRGKFNCDIFDIL